MKYLASIWADGRPAPEDLAVIQRELPAWIQEMGDRGVRLLGRELRLPETAATVRVRDGETLVTDGPFMETKEFVAGFDLLECTDLDDALEVVARHPSSWFQAIEIRPFAGGLRLGEKAAAFAREDDSAGSPHLLSTWIAGTPFDARAAAEAEAWRRDLEARGLHVLGSLLSGPDAATTVRVRDGETLVSDGPGNGREEFIAGIEVVSCADRRQALELAATHPLAREHAIEVRPFYSE